MQFAISLKKARFFGKTELARLFTGNWLSPENSFSLENGFSPKSASPQKWLLPKNDFFPKEWCLPRKWLSPEKLNIFVGSRYISNDSDKPKLKEDYHHLYFHNYVFKYVLALFWKKS